MFVIKRDLHLSQHGQYYGNYLITSLCGSLFCVFLAKRKLFGRIEENPANDKKSGSFNPPPPEVFRAKWGEHFTTARRRRK